MNVFKLGAIDSDLAVSQIGVSFRAHLMHGLNVSVNKSWGIYGVCCELYVSV